MSDSRENPFAPQGKPETLNAEGELIDELVSETEPPAASAARGMHTKEGELHSVSDGTSRTTDRVASGIFPQEPTPEELAEEQAKPARKGLRVLLIVAVVALAVIAAVIAVLAWRYSASPDVTPAQTERLASGDGETSTVTFEAVDADDLPAVNKLYGLTYKQAKKKLGKDVVFAKTLEKATDERVSSLKYLANGTIANASGEQIASVSLGLTKKRKVVYTYVSYDLDALGVATAEFQVLCNDRTVAASLLSSTGLSDSVVESAALSLQENPEANTSQESSSSQQCTFQGETGAKLKTVTKTKKVIKKVKGKKKTVKKKIKVKKQVAFQYWVLAQVYQRDSSSDATLRSTVIELY